ncbi:hypothetical protein [Bacillus wiedmannii]|uniref:hypothetical protein n=1 Tax=Bacillus wiedmannii TaxID=1890302 RepID=UPI0012472A6E|nr:hypothetical protein [Bacillus wiedmannii]
MDTNKNVLNKEQEEALGLNGLEQEEVAVVEEVNPLAVRVIFFEGRPLEFIVHNMVKGQFREWIVQNVLSQVVADGMFIGNTYIPNSNIKYFEEA